MGKVTRGHGVVKDGTQCRPSPHFFFLLLPRCSLAVGS